ncbi:hypothetical protein NBRGN_068_01450 [Nocardia brasiliensis NBRC 14402]|uniref:Uncharacterized protein n=1 Tax=Nocardia brasiliensis (strain ATCC 700358 / HUJEG-1) TaxID=1133849 RepID=K0F296_NOCB7|nr:ribbon-helix-helix protein, CopG family [Nocardia brasiliensis]AFU03245.1 hypothetical protein O3I_026480 [Nocardia brasiliensis ATCC 700358]ASF06771.1 ribbon-helix-helix protein, CopG family [Nocardia brasiliensis]OCF86889.1 hypothetical protein AW168_28515 [Nocardia brasiliensis]SUB48033.1 Uncharacterised protein [Nocardia brasiliensis]GAJ84152.1 hypothetical protein NBRGN_068_01450 [Nocardia brasiliensis NBRC 14402]
MATEQLTITVSEELAAAVKRAAAAAGQSISGFAAAALRLELIAVEAGCPPGSPYGPGDAPPRFADVMTVLAHAEDVRQPVLNG